MSTSLDPTRTSLLDVLNPLRKSVDLYTALKRLLNFVFHVDDQIEFDETIFKSQTLRFSLSGIGRQTDYSMSGRVIGTVYHNTGPYPLFITITGAVTALVDKLTTPTTTIVTGNPVTFVVLPHYNYKVTGGPFTHWFEWEYPGAGVGNDIGQTWFKINLTKDSNNNATSSELFLTNISLSTKISPATQDHIIDALISKDNGVTFNTMLFPDNADKLVIKQNTNVAKFSDKFSLSSLKEGWLLRFDEVQDGGADGVEIVFSGVLR